MLLICGDSILNQEWVIPRPCRGAGPPKYAVSHVVGYIKGKSAIHLARVYGEQKRSFVGQSFWARG
jgi:hypothetical protein